MSYLIKDLQEDLKRIKVEGFRFKKGQGAFYWEKWDNGAQFTATTSIHKGYDFFLCQGIGCSVIFSEITEILRQTMAEVGRPTQELFPLLPAGRRFEGIDYSVFDIKVRDSTTAQRVGAELEKAIKLGVLPLFESFATLELTAERLAQLSWQETVKILHGDSRFLVPALILQITNHSKYGEVRDQLQERLKREASEDSRMEKTVLAFERLFSS